MIVIQWAATILLWLAAGAFFFSGILLAMMMLRNRRDREMSLMIGVIVVLFAVFSALAVCGALAVGRCL